MSGLIDSPHGVSCGCKRKVAAVQKMDVLPDFAEITPSARIQTTAHGWRAKCLQRLDYTHLGLGVDARGRARLPLKVEVAGRGLVESAPTAGTPWWRLPTAGGSQLLRGAPLGRWRARPRGWRGWV
jgi:hypothetical protein